MGNSFQSPITGEPSMGTPHAHFVTVLNTDPVDANWHSVDLSAEAPVGVTSVELLAAVQSTTVGRQLAISDTSSGTNLHLRIAVQATSGRGWICGSCPLSSTRLIWWNVDDADVSLAFIVLKRYDE